MGGLELFGREINASDEEQPIKLSEVSVMASPDGLRRLARFFEHYASELEARRLPDHAHFTDFERANRDSPVEIVIANPALYSKRS